MINILIADDHPIVRQGLKQTLADSPMMKVADEACDGHEVIEKLQERSFDVCLLDISMPGKGGIDILKVLKNLKIQTPILILSTHPEDQYALRALRSGASGYLTKNCESEDLIKAIQKVARGGKYISETLAERLAMDVGKDATKQPFELLSDREFEVFGKIASGQTVSEIGDEMALSVKTISTYRMRVLDKLNMKNNSELTRYAIKNNLIN